MREHSIRRRLALLVALQALAVLGIVCAGIYWAVGAHMARSQERLLDIKVNKLTETAQLMLRAGDPRYQELLLANASRRPGTFLELLHTDGRVFHRDAGDGENALPIVHREKRFALPFADGSETLLGRYAIDVESDESKLAFLRVVLLLAVLVGSVGAGLLANIAVRRGLQPLSALASQTQRMSADRLGDRLSLDAPVAELQPWVDQFNRLMERLEQAYRQLESFNADVAHELRTPLSALIGHTELAISRERPVGELRETLQSNLEELQRLSTIANDMLFLSRADRGATARRQGARSLARLAGQVAELHEAALHERRLTVRIEGDTAWAVDEGLFKQALSNLIDNAVRHATPGSVITVHVEAERPDEVWVTVENQGEAVASDHLSRLFERFFRVERSRRDGGAHHGLGLAIVAAIARMHRGRTRAESLEGRTRIGFTLGAPG